MKACRINKEMAVPGPLPLRKKKRKLQSKAFLLKVTVSDLQLRSGRSDWKCSDSLFPVILVLVHDASRAGGTTVSFFDPYETFQRGDIKKHVHEITWKVKDKKDKEGCKSGYRAERQTKHHSLIVWLLHTAAVQTVTLCANINPPPPPARARAEQRVRATHNPLHYLYHSLTLTKVWRKRMRLKHPTHLFIGTQH